MTTIMRSIVASVAVAVLLSAPLSASSENTQISIADGRWCLNGRLTYPGTQAEGLLMNVRMVNAVFEDTHRPGFDTKENTSEFTAKIPEYVAHGIRAFTINLQGGSHGYLGDDFIDAILRGRKPRVDVIDALNMTVPGYYAHLSSMKNGETMKIPQYSL